jgi:serine protease Do
MLRTLGLAAAVILPLPSCGPPSSAPRVAAASPASASASAPLAEGKADEIDVMEGQVTGAIARVRESAVALEYTAADAPSGARRRASGVVICDNGEILSVRIDAPPAASPIMAMVASGRRLPARWMAADPETGLTLLQVDPGFTRPATPSPRGARPGIPVLVIGNPFGLAQSVGRGFVAGLNRRLELGTRQLGGLIQVGAALHPGDSGALVADLHGGWLGVIRSGLALPSDDDRHGREYDHDLGFAIPANDALWVAQQLRTRKRVDRAYLGVMMDLAAPAPADGSEGAVLGRVLADTPAERAGLKSGDRVVALDGQSVRSPYDLTDRLDRTPADAEVTLDLVRSAIPSPMIKRLTLRTSRRPPSEPSRPSSTRKSRAEEPRAPRPVSREVAETIERLEHRIEELEKQRETAATHQR